MLKRLFPRTLLVLTCVGLIFATGTSQAQKGKGDDEAEKMAKRADSVNDLARAAQLIDFGYGRIGESTGISTKNPEALVSAAGILLRVHASTGGKFAPLDEKAPADKDVLENQSLKEEAELLIADARKLVENDKDRKAALEEMIKQATKFEARGAVGSPRSQTRNIGPGGVWTFNIGFVPLQPAAVTFRSAGTSKLRFEVLGEGGRELFSLTGHWANYAWTPAGDKKDGKRSITLRVTNVGRNASTFTMNTN